MTSMLDKFHRRSVRLQGYDYTHAGAYFLTICTYHRQLLFSDPAIAKIVEEQWKASAVIRRELNLDAFVVMPNHVHGVVWIVEDEGSLNMRIQKQKAQRVSRDDVGAQGLRPRQTQANSIMLHVSPRSLGAFVRGFKSSVTHEVTALRNTQGIPVWQRSYYEHVVRNEEELNRIRQYIADNPVKWDEDENNPANVHVTKPVRGS